MRGAAEGKKEPLGERGTFLKGAGKASGIGNPERGGTDQREKPQENLAGESQRKRQPYPIIRR